MLPLPASVTVHGRLVPVSVVEELGELEQPARISLDRLLSDPEALDRRCRAALLEPTHTLGHGETRLYVEHHLNLMGLSAEPPPALSLTGVEAVVRAMTMHAIWVTADDMDEFLHVDYTIDPTGT